MTDHDADRGSEHSELFLVLADTLENKAPTVYERVVSTIRALEARVREVEEQRDTAMTDRHDEMAELRADRDRIAAELCGTQTRLSEMAGEVERLEAEASAQRNRVADLRAANLGFLVDNTRLTSELDKAREELAQRREHMRRGMPLGVATPARWDNDDARSASEGGEA